MAEFTLLFELDHATQSHLRPLSALPADWKDRDLKRLEKHLRDNYQRLSLGHGTLPFDGYLFAVQKLNETGRLPSLELRLVSTTDVPGEGTRELSAVPAPPKDETPQALSPASWYTAWLQEIEATLKTEAFAAVPELDLCAVRIVTKELETWESRLSSPQRALVLFAALTKLIEAQNRMIDQSNSRKQYALALEGLEPVLRETPLGSIANQIHPLPTPTWFGRFWERLKAE